MKNTFALVGGAAVLLMHTDPAIWTLTGLLALEGALLAVGGAGRVHLSDAWDPWLRQVVLDGAVLVVVALGGSYLHMGSVTVEGTAAILTAGQLSRVIKVLSAWGRVPVISQKTSVPPTGGNAS